MSTIQLLIYDVIESRDHHEASGPKKTAVASGAPNAGVIVAHLSIVVHGEEFEYGKNGVSVSYEPGAHPTHPNQIEVLLGKTAKSEQEIRSYVKKLRKEKFTKSGYNSTSNNCVHFVDELCQFLLDGESVPLETLQKINHPFVQQFDSLVKARVNIDEPATAESASGEASSCSVM